MPLNEGPSTAVSRGIVSDLTWVGAPVRVSPSRQPGYRLHARSGPFRKSKAQRACLECKVHASRATSNHLASLQMDSTVLHGSPEESAAYCGQSMGTIEIGRKEACR
eukprot:scaffold2522_cov22-Tisochrysis_lutea.AAC.6